MDYRKFLNQSSIEVLPYLGGTRVDALRRRLRVADSVEKGWWRFEVQGRDARALRREPVPDLSQLPGQLPVLHGHLVDGYLFVSGRQVETVHLLPEEQAADFSPCTARRWPSGDVLFESLAFEQDAETACRAALAHESTLAGTKSIPASCRAAFGYAVLKQQSAQLTIALSPREVIGACAEVAEQGLSAARRVLYRLQQMRLDERRRVQARRLQSAWHAEARVNRRQPRRAQYDLAETVGAALDNTGAVLLTTRRLENAMAEVCFRFMGEQFICVVDADSLQVFDAGICLDGQDKALNLDCLPAVIREAIEDNALYITRR